MKIVNTRRTRVTSFVSGCWHFSITKCFGSAWVQLKLQWTPKSKSVHKDGNMSQSHGDSDIDPGPEYPGSGTFDAIL